MNIVKALQREEARAVKKLTAVRTTIKYFRAGGLMQEMSPRKMSASARARISKAQKARWAKVRSTNK